MRSTIHTPHIVNEKSNKPVLSNGTYPKPSEANSKHRLFMVCEGIDHHEKTSEATQLIINEFERIITQSKSLDEKPLGQLLINDALRFAERKIQQFNQQHKKNAETLLTLSLVYFNFDGTVTIAWVGNCRVYQIRKGQIIYHTEDQMTTIQQREKRIVLPRAINGKEPAWASATKITNLQEGDYFLLSSAGIHTAITNTELCEYFAHAETNNETNKKIIDQLKTIGQPLTSNTTIGLLQIKSTPLESEPVGIVQQTSVTAMAGEKPLFSNQSKKSDWGSTKIDTSKILAVLSIIAIVVLLSSGTYFAYQNMVQKPKNEFKQLVKEGERQFEQKNYEKAASIFQQISQSDLASDSLKKAFSLKNNTINNYLSLLQNGDSLLRQQQLFKARNAYQQAADLQLNGNTTPQEKIIALNQQITERQQQQLNLGDSLYLKRKYQDASQHYLQAIYYQQNTDSILRLVNLSRKKLRLDTLSKAQADSTAQQLVQQSLKNNK